MATQIHGAGPTGQRSPGLDLAIAGYLTDNPPAGTGGSGVTATDAPTAPAEGASASYLVTSAVTWPAGLVWSTDPDGGTAPTITDAALVSLFTVDGTTYAVMGSTYPAVEPSPDETDPTPGTLAASSITDTGFTLTVTGAADETALHATPYAFSTDNGTTWSAWQAGATYNATGLSASTAYQARHKVRDAALNEATGTAITVTTGATYNPLTAITWHSVYSAAELSLSNGESVTTWPDSSGNGRDATATATAPTYTAASANFGNQPVVAFNNTELKTATFTDLAQPGSIVVIGWPSTTGTTQRFVAGGSATKRWDVLRFASASTWRMAAGTDLAGRSWSAPAIVVATFDGVNSTIRVNGPTGQVTGNAGTYDMGQIRLGATSLGEAQLVGEIAFVGLKATPLTAQEIADLEAWAAAQYGISIS